MKYKLLTLLILSLSAINLSFAEEKKKSNYFGDDNYHSREFKKNKKQELKHKTSNLNIRDKREKKHSRVKSSTDTH